MVYIGIDPDTDKNGVAYYNNITKKISLHNLRYFELFDFLMENKKNCSEVNGKICVIIEAGWLNKKSNFHDKKKQSKAVGEMIAKRVGANHQAGEKIVEMCEYLNINYKEIKPTTAKWDADFCNKIVGKKIRSNQDNRDALKLVIGR